MRRYVLFLLIGVFATPLFALFDLGNNEEITVATLWHGGGQYVRLVKPTPSTKKEVLNRQHPIELDARSIEEILRNLEITQGKKRWWGSSDSNRNKAILLLTPNMANLLATQIAKGLKEADTSTEIVFAIHGFYHTGLLKSSRGIGGRVFYQDNQLHIIMGDVLRDMREDRDSRGVAFTDAKPNTVFVSVGSRDRRISDGYTILPMTGISFNKGRGDWLIIDVAVASKQAKRLEYERSLPPGLLAESQKIQKERETMGEQQRTMLLEMAKLRQEMKADQQQNTKQQNSPEKRLKRLNMLRGKELITEEEYQSTRRAILDSI